MNDRIMIIDHSAVCHAVKYSLGKYKLSFEEKPTFVIFGYLNMLQVLFRTIRPDRVAFACDSKKSKRKNKYPHYKSKRLEKSEEEQAMDLIAYPQFTILKERVLPEIGFKNIFEQKGLEGDDIMASICLTHPQQDIVLVTRDKDMYQCLNKYVCMFDPTSKIYFGNVDFEAKYGIKPEQWGEVKSIAGCTTDDVLGIEGVAELTAIKYLLGTLNKTKANGEPTKVYQNLISKKGKKIIKRNRKLVILPYKNTPAYHIRPDQLLQKGLLKVAKAYGFKSIKKDIDSWTKILRLQ